MSSYLLHIFTLIGLYLPLTLALGLSVGLGRLFNLAHTAFWAVGAYTLAILTTDQGVDFWPAFGCGLFVASVAALIVGAVAARLPGDYFAMGSLALSALVSSLLINWRELTRGVLGIPGIPRPEVGYIFFSSEVEFAILVWLYAVLSGAALWFIWRGRFGLLLKAQAEYGEAAASLGVNTSQVRLTSFVIAAMVSAGAGAFFAAFLSYIDPGSFSLNGMVFILSCVVVGGARSFGGIIAATMFLILLPEGLRFVDIPSSILGQVRQLLYAGILFAMVFLLRNKIFPRERKV